MFYFDVPSQLQAFLNQYWMAINYFLIFSLFLLAYITAKKPALGVAILIILFPTYLFRTKIFGLPTTYLEVSLITTLVTFLIKIMRQRGWEKGYRYPLRTPLTLLLVASTVSVFIAPNTLAALGLWKAYFIEPALFFILLFNVVKTNKDKNMIVWALGISTLSISLLSIYQKFTGFGIAEPQWLNAASRRVTAFFTSPNAVGLYLGPITVIYFGWLIQEMQNAKCKMQNLGKIILLLLMATAIIFTQSQGTWLGIAAGVIFICFFAINKKWTAIATTTAIFLLLITPMTQKVIMPYLAFSDRAGQNRLNLWKGSMKYLTASPKNFIFGAGLYGFPRVQEQFRDPKKIEPLVYPHNFFLNFWMETGFLGLIAILWLIISFFHSGFKNYKLRIAGYQLIIMAAMIAMLVHGLVDVPYFKNDLSMLFWTLVALIYI